MKASLRWLNEFVELPTDDPGEIAEVLSNLGIEVETIETIEAGFGDVVVARVLDVAPHPNADRVRIATLDAGGDPIEVVCGAWNFEAGATVAYAKVGAVLPGGFEVGEKAVRGVMSPGMICSEAELGLGDEADGILVLEDGHAEPGADFAATLPYPDVVFDVSITPNRPDAMSIHGMGRDLAAFYDLEVRTPEISFDETGTTNATVHIEEPERCPRFTAREVEGVVVAPSPLWMRLRLRNAGVRPISNIVDISNYVMLEFGQPLHAFDLDRIAEEKIIVRPAAEGEVLRTLDGVERTLTSDDLLIAGIDQPLGLAGVMGGGDSEVSDTTSRVLIEVAHFEPTGVLLTGKRHAVRTEAVARFERGVDPELPPVASARAAMLIAEFGGGSVVGGFVDEYPNPVERVTVELPAAEAGRLLGVEIADVDQAAYLRRLGFEVAGDDPMTVLIPTFRPDVTRPADLVEEIARVHGYNEIPSRLPIGPGGGLSAGQKAVRAVRAIMVGAGFFEIMSFDFLGIGEIEALDLAPDDLRRDPVRIRNPLNEEQEYLRTTLLPGLLSGLRRTAQRNRPDAALFEIGSVFRRGGGELPDQPHHLGFVATGRRSGLSRETAGMFDAFDALGVIEVLADSMGIRARIEQSEVPGLHPGRSGVVLGSDGEIGFVGELDPDVGRHWDLTGRVIVAELALNALFGAGDALFAIPSPYPPVVFDLAFDLADEVPSARLVDEVRAAAGEDLERIEIFDVFKGEQLAAGRKSVAVRLTMRNAERTLTDDETVGMRERISGQVADELGGTLRGG